MPKAENTTPDVVTDSVPTDGLVSKTFAALGATTLPLSYRLAMGAPLWQLKLARRSKLGAGVVALFVAMLVSLVVIVGLQVVLVGLAGLIVPGLPNSVIATSGVSANEVATNSEAFMFVGIMPTIFLVVTGGVVAGLVSFVILKFALRYIAELVSCAVVSKTVVSQMVQLRSSQLPASVVTARKSRHIVDFAASAMSSDADSAEADTAATNKKKK